MTYAGCSVDRPGGKIVSRCETLETSQGKHFYASLPLSTDYMKRTSSEESEDIRNVHVGHSEQF